MNLGRRIADAGYRIGERGLKLGVGSAIAGGLIVATCWGVFIPGCAAMQGVQSGVQGGVQGVQSGAQTGDSVKGLGNQAKDLVTGKKKDDPEGEGDDDDRLRAKESQINTPLDDKLNAKKGDREDWRKFQLQGRPGVATFELFWDDEKSNLDIDVYDAFGVSIGRSPPRMEGQSVKRILVSVQKAGTYYVRIRTQSEKDKSIYTLNVKWAGPPVVAVAPPPERPVAPPPTTPDAGAATAGGVPVPPSLLNDPNKLQGSIISAYRDGPGWVLYIDRGSAQKVRQGLSGAILEGGDGEKLVERGDFTISQVVDGNKSIARTSLAKPPGKNKRVLINLR